jgi:caffeoyl-CoA O-methyltransferase
LHTIENRQADAKVAQANFEKAGITNKIKLHVGNALEIIELIDEVFDMVFIDADKTNYVNYFEMVLPKVKKGGCILVDNVLFHGQVLKQSVKGKNAKAIHEFNNRIKNDKRINHSFLTIRDGIMLIKKL